MIAKLRSSTFIDTLQFELAACTQNCLKAVLRDEQGSICSQLETTITQAKPEVTWKGLNDLPYGVYTLELSQGDDELRLKMVKRI